MVKFIEGKFNPKTSLIPDFKTVCSKQYVFKIEKLFSWSSKDLYIEEQVNL